MGSILRATFFGAIISYVCLICGFLFFSNIRSQLSDFEDEKQVRQAIEKNIKQSGIYLIPSVLGSGSKGNKVGYNPENPKKLNPVEIQLTADAATPGNVPVGDQQVEVTDEQVEDVEKISMPDLVVVMAVQQSGSTLNSIPKSITLFLIQFFATLMVATVTVLMKKTNYLHNVLINTLCGWMQIITMSLVAVFYLGFPLKLFLVIDQIVGLSWLVAAIFMSLYTKAKTKVSL